MSPTGRDVLSAYLVAQLDHLRAVETEVRQDAPDSVHQMRVTARRISAALRTFLSLWDQDTTSLRTELRWLGQALGAARDAEVMLARLQRLAADEHQDGRPLDRHETWTLIQTELASRSEKAQAAVIDALDSRRYSALLDRLGQLADQGPWSKAARRPARSALGPPVRRAWRRVRRRAKRAGQKTGAPEHAARLHAVRKAARRARYAGEVVEPVFGRDAARFAERVTEIQDILGARHDSAVSETLLEDLAARDAASGHVLVYGRLTALEQRLGKDAERQWEQRWPELKGNHVAGWLRS